MAGESPRRRCRQAEPGLRDRVCLDSPLPVPARSGPAEHLLGPDPAGVGSGQTIFLLKGFFDSLPKEFYEAAVIDGVGEVTIVWRITLPMARPVLDYLGLGAFTAAPDSRSLTPIRDLHFSQKMISSPTPALL